MKKVGFYGRVSTEHEAQINALENQKLWYEEKLKEHNDWVLYDYYIDEGVTGTQAKKRDGFMRMIKDAKEGKIDLVVTREISRFARNTLDAIAYTRYLKSIGVEIYFVSDCIWTFAKDGEMQLSLIASFAQDESRKTSDRVTAGQLISREKGVIYGNGNILGYDRINGQLVVNPEQAETVKTIFDLYLKGYGCQKIADELERQNRLTSTGKTRWHSGTINHVLQNSTYCGILEYGKEITTDFLTHKRVINHDDSTKFRVRGDYEILVSEEDFNEVQKIVKSKRNSTSLKNMGKKAATTVWGKLLVCSCGHKFCKYDYKHGGNNISRMYNCYSRKNGGSANSREKRGLSTEGCCTTPMIPEWKLQFMAKLIFNDHIKNIDDSVNIAKYYLEKHIKDIDETEQIRNDIDTKKKAIENKQKYIDGLIDMCASSIIDKATFMAKRLSADKEIEELEKSISELELSIGEEEIDYFARLEDIKKSLGKYTKRNQKIIPDNLVMALTDKIVASSDTFDWYLYPTEVQINDKPFSPEDAIQVGIREELSPKRTFIKVAEFTITKEEAKNYLYSFSKKKRLYNWKDTTVNIWI